MGCGIVHARNKELGNKTKHFTSKLELISPHAKQGGSTNGASPKCPQVFPKSLRGLKSKENPKTKNPKLQIVLEVNSFCERSCDFEI